MKIVNRFNKKGFCLPGGYRYCGPGCSGPGKPINYVDSCCQKHDACINRYGHCYQCDQMLIDCVNRKKYASRHEGATARVIDAAMRFRMLWG